jgi:hypothetical protein
MPVDRIATSNQVIVRNNMGRFISELEAAGGATVDDMLKEGAALSRALAPRGKKPTRRGDIPIADSIFIRKISRTAGVWGSASKHALPQETGSKRHDIPGNPGLRFWWERKGRMFEPAKGKITVVDHPGNPAHPFLRPAYERVFGGWMKFARKNYR